MQSVIRRFSAERPALNHRVHRAGCVVDKWPQGHVCLQIPQLLSTSHLHPTNISLLSIATLKVEVIQLYKFNFTLLAMKRQ